MPRRALALLCLAACAAPSAGPPTPAVERTAGAPVPKDSSPMLADSDHGDQRGSGAPVPGDTSSAVLDSQLADPRRAGEPVPSDSQPTAPSHGPPRLLAAAVTGFGVLADGGVLIEPRATSPEVDEEPTDTPPGALERVDPDTGARTRWHVPWTPTGWRLRGEPTLIGFAVSPDGRWVALAHSFEIRRNPALDRPGLVALIVARSDGSDPRCVGVGVPSDDPPPYAFSRDGRLIGDWTVACAPGPRGVPVALRADGELDVFPRLQQWYDPDDGTRGEVPEIEPWWYDKDPLGDHVAMQDYEAPPALVFRNFATGARVGAVPLAAGSGLRVRDWVSDDMVLAEVMHADPAARELRLATTDGRTFPAPHAQWRVYTRLPDGTHLLSRDGGATVEHGRVDWPRFTVVTSHRRPDLEPFVRPHADGSGRADPTWTPGLGGVLIHDDTTGDLHLAAL